PGASRARYAPAASVTTELTGLSDASLKVIRAPSSGPPLAPPAPVVVTVPLTPHLLRPLGTLTTMRSLPSRSSSLERPQERRWSLTLGRLLAPARWSLT